jgi:hypothetical protein
MTEIASYDINFTPETTRADVSRSTSAPTTYPTQRQGRALHKSVASDNNLPR